MLSLTVYLTRTCSGRPQPQMAAQVEVVERLKLRYRFVFPPIRLRTVQLTLLVQMRRLLLRRRRRRSSIQGQLTYAIRSEPMSLGGAAGSLQRLKRGDGCTQRNLKVLARQSVRDPDVTHRTAYFGGSDARYPYFNDSLVPRRLSESSEMQPCCLRRYRAQFLEDSNRQFVRLDLG